MATAYNDGLEDIIAARSAICRVDGEAGRLYYRIGLRYAPDSLVLEPLDRGFTVERSYEGVDDPKDVKRADDGAWHIRADRGCAAYGLRLEAS